MAYFNLISITFIAALSFSSSVLARDIPKNLTASQEQEYAKLQCGDNAVGFWETRADILDGHTQLFGNESLTDSFLVYRVCNMNTETKAEVMASGLKTYPLAPFACIDVKFKKYLSVKSFIEEDKQTPTSFVYGHYCKIGN
ncbi:hypothetical protein [Curvivirga aplysinae]|uniref:hypothetical protein n=1 Tax=Curvivirga aplysinae TaxID=2529852 RepID=UPI0012BB6099|nr:hypothetical protein [Curvivirga aplysinae]MTI09155.1 hypothetical protein [Curvivirga aplysinae]